MRRVHAAVVCIVCVLLTGATALAQITPFGGGVWIDPSGTLRAREVDYAASLKQARNRALKGKESLVYVSLPRLFDEARKQIQSGKELTHDVRCLHGMTRLRYVFVYPNEKDLVIAGTVEDYDVVGPRIVGKQTGRPVIQLDDLVLAMRTLGPGSRQRGFGCSIDLTADQLNAAADAARKFGAIHANQRGELARAMAKAAGSQQVRVMGVDPGNRLAMVCVEADYLLKRLALGLDRSPITSVPSYLSQKQREDGMYVRWWFEAMHEAMLVSTDGLSFGFRGPSLQVKTSSSVESNAVPASAGANRYAELLTQKMPELSAAIGAFADLQNASDLALLAALIAHDKLHEKAGWDPSWAMRDAGYAVASVPTPTTAETLVAYRPLGGSVIFGFGGVQIRPTDSLGDEYRTPDDKGELPQLSARPAEGQWALVVRGK